MAWFLLIKREHISKRVSVVTTRSYWLTIDAYGQNVVMAEDVEDAVRKSWSDSITAVIKLDEDMIADIKKG